jgi:exodeoxyribonuclease-5
VSAEPPTLRALTDDQLDAVDRIERCLASSPEAVLVGPAGSGKTTLVRALLDRLAAAGRPVALAAPTGKAALRLAEATGLPATTLHRRLYRSVDDDEDGDGLRFSQPRSAAEPGAVLVVDEASMVGTRLYQDVTSTLAPGAAVLWVGDREQLEPIDDRWGPNLAEPTAALRTVHRQAADHPVLAYATAIREGRGAAWRRAWPNDDERVSLRAEPLEAAIDWTAAAARDGRDAATLTWTHQVREEINAGVRRRLGLTGPLAAGDRVVVRMNSESVGLVNGELLAVDHVHPTEMFGRPVLVLTLAGQSREVRVFTEHVDDRGRGVWATRKAIGPSRWDRYRFLHLWHGHCLTVHSAQGSQWPDVGFVYGPSLPRQARAEPDAARRLVYTAVTRASARLTVFELPSS